MTDKMREALIAAKKIIANPHGYTELSVLVAEALIGQAAQSVPTTNLTEDERFDLLGEIAESGGVGRLPRQPMPMECCGCPVEGNEYMGQVQLVCCGNPEPTGVAASVLVVGEVVAYACPFHASNQFVNGTPCMLVEAVSVNGYGKERGFPLVVQPTHSITAAELERLRKDAENWRNRHEVSK